MALSTLDTPANDPTPIFDIFRGNFGTELLTAAVAHFNLFGVLAKHGPLGHAELQKTLGLADRPAVVLFTFLQAMGLLRKDGAGKLSATPLAAEYFTPGAYFDVSKYLDLGSESPCVKSMVTQLREDKPAGTREESKGAEYTFDDSDEASAMADPAVARILTVALAGRARNCAPYLSKHIPMQAGQTLLDIGGGSGVYAIAFLQRYPGTKAILIDAPEVLKVAAEIAAEYAVGDRLELLAGNMFKSKLPAADVMLLSNVLHDWDVPDCRRLVAHCAAHMPRGGKLLIHDVFLNDAMDGPLPVAIYSAALMTITKGRAYSGAEYRSWCEEAGLKTEPTIKPTLVHCGVLTASKP